MDSSRGKSAIELVAESFRRCAANVRVKAEAILSDTRLTDEQRNEMHKGLLEAAKKCEEHARWWISGEGPPP